MGIDTGHPKQAEIKAAALQYLNMDSLRHIGMIEPILHDTAEILYASNDGVFVMEKKSGAYFLSAQETSLGIDLLGRTEGIALLCVF